MENSDEDTPVETMENSGEHAPVETMENSGEDVPVETMENSGEDAPDDNSGETPVENQGIEKGELEGGSRYKHVSRRHRRATRHFTKKKYKGLV
jgi:hypothetical protein